jgi:PAS domain S-box-containing protein
MKKNHQKNRRILVIDDSERIHEDFRAVLGPTDADTAAFHEAKTAIFGKVPNVSEHVDFELDSALQGRDGLERVRQALREGRPYAMAFVDIRMPPGWDGVETIRRIWQVYPELEVVICTAYSDYDWNEIIAKLGQTDRLLILKKPFDNVEVYQLASALTEKWDLARQAEAALEASEAKYQDLYDNAPDMFATIDAKTAKILQCNHTLATATGYSKEAIIGRPIFDMYHPDCMDEAKKAFNSFVDAGEVYDSELQLKRKDGGKIDVSLNVSSVRDDQGHVLCGSLSWRDITDRKRAEERLEQQRRSLESMFRAAPVGMMLVDENIVIKQINDVILKLVRRDASEVTNARPGDGLNCIHSRDVAEGCGHAPACEQCKIRKSIESVFESDQSVQGVEIEAVFLIEGKPVSVWLDVSVEPVKLDGKRHAIVALNNITDRKQAGEMLKEAKRRAEAASMIKSQFLANMSHEIRTPMNSIIGFSEMLAADKLTDEQRQYADLIRESGKNLMKIISDILDFSKIEAGKLDMDIFECDLAGILADVDSVLRPQAEGKALKFGVMFGDQMPARIRTDPARLRQCLINLANNAIKFTETGHVHINVVTEHAGDKGPCIRFDVEDTGIGIKPEDRERIFESFTQADGSICRKYGGAGLGLAITRQLAHLLGGQVTVTGEEGKGSTFSLIIPMSLDLTKQLLSGAGDTADRMNGGGENMERVKLSGHVLVAEDVRANQVLAKALLERMGLEVTIAADGNETVQKARAHDFDLIFMDIQMPEMDGYQATRAIREQGIKTPIIALTANAMKGDDEKCVEAGCDDYLPKPLDRRRLLEKIQKYLCVKDKAACQNTEAPKPKENGTSEISSNRAPEESGVSQTSEAADSTEILNWDELIGRLGDEELIRDIVPIFLNDNKERIERLTEAVEVGDAKTLKLYAHAVKGAAGNIGAIRLSDIAHRLECAGREDDLAAAAPLFDALKTELEKVVAFLSLEDWIEIAKREKVITDDKLDAGITCRC